MELVKITDLTGMLGITSRSLRYYEQAGLIRSVRPDSGRYRYYDTANIERLRQIIVLRKMQIPVKDILRIYENEDMSIVVETFVNRIRAIDEEVNALTDLRRIVNDFLVTMTQNGITKISALPLLYETMEKQLDSLGTRKTGSYQELAAITERLSGPVQPSLVQLPSMRVLSSCLKENRLYPRRTPAAGTSAGGSDIAGQPPRACFPADTGEKAPAGSHAFQRPGGNTAGFHHA